jgi:predicted transcriptional regulator
MAKELKIPKVKRACSNCQGTGKVDCILGSKMRELRERAGISVRAMAGRIEISAMYLSDLELGRRQFSEKLAERFVEECARA